MENFKIVGYLLSFTTKGSDHTWLKRFDNESAANYYVRSVGLDDARVYMYEINPIIATINERALSCQ